MLALRLRKGLTQQQLAGKIGVSHQTVSKWESGVSFPRKDKIKRVADILGVEVGQLMGDNISKEANVHSISPVNYVELPFIPIRARASFVDTLHDQGQHTMLERYSIVVEPGTQYTNLHVIEVDGDSMEPYYPSRTKLLCSEVSANNWEYLNSGIYAVVYRDFFVVKRVKQGPANGMLTLHSDNTETGGTMNIPLSEIRRIWKATKVVESPIR